MTSNTIFDSQSVQESRFAILDLRHKICITDMKESIQIPGIDDALEHLRQAYLILNNGSSNIESAYFESAGYLSRRD